MYHDHGITYQSVQRRNFVCHSVSTEQIAGVPAKDAFTGVAAMNPVVFRAPGDRRYLVQEPLAHLQHPPVLLPMVNVEPGTTEIFGELISLLGDFSGQLYLLFGLHQDLHALPVVLGEELFQTAYVPAITLLIE